MKIGFVNIYSFRPHVEHLYFLSELLRSSGHEVFFQTCDGRLTDCYPRQLKKTSKTKECSKCIIGGIRSYSVENVTSIKKAKFTELTETENKEIALSSSCTLNRTETDHEWDDEPLIDTRESLKQPISDVFESTREWIKSNHLDAVICFNGRMELPRAVTYACQKEGVPFVTHERTWFGDGIQLIPNASCLSLTELGKMVEAYSQLPLTSEQSMLAGKLLGVRFVQSNTLEWRVYNSKPEPIEWPGSKAGKKILVLPSSKNEFAGEESWKTGWKSNTSAIDDFLDNFGFSGKQVVLRCHPNWSENIGKVSGQRSLSHYEDWARSRGVKLIKSDDKASTYDLIKQADIVVMNGGSSAVEAGACGKQIICLGPSPYEFADFVQTFRCLEEMLEQERLVERDEDDIRRKTLRYVYVRARRFAQYTDYVKAIATTKYEYFVGADSERIIKLINTGRLEADDQTFAENSSFEDDTIELLKEMRWQELASYQNSYASQNLDVLNIGRRKSLRWLDKFRENLKRGDR